MPGVGVPDFVWQRHVRLRRGERGSGFPPSPVRQPPGFGEAGGIRGSRWRWVLAASIATSANALRRTAPGNDRIPSGQHQGRASALRLSGDQAIRAIREIPVQYWRQNGAVNDAPPIPHVDDLRPFAAATKGLRLLVLFGSRARGESHPASDWDFGYPADPACDVDALLASLSERLCADRLDLVDLARAGGQLRFRAARDGRVVFAQNENEWERSWTDAVSFWYDAGPVLPGAYDSTLRELRR